MYYPVFLFSSVYYTILCWTSSNFLLFMVIPAKNSVFRGCSKSTLLLFKASFLYRREHDEDILAPSSLPAIRTLSNFSLEKDVSFYIYERPSGTASNHMKLFGNVLNTEQKSLNTDINNVCWPSAIGWLEQTFNMFWTFRAL